MTSDGCNDGGDRAIRARITIVSPRAVVTLDPLARNPIVVDAGVLSDVALVVLQIRRSPLAQVGIADAAVRGLGRGFADTVGATDDLGGALSVDDDQVIEYGKAFDRIARVADTRRADTTKPVADGTGVRELASLGMSRPASDTAQTADAATRLVAYMRAFPQIYALDYFAEDYVDTDGARATDAMQRGVARSIERTARATDAASRAVGRPLSDAAVASDAVARSVARAIADAAAAADQIASRAIDKARANAASADDAGSLVSQGYTDSNTYFAADFVGTSRTFT